MGQITIPNKPEGFSEYFTKKLAECVARGIVEKSIRTIHSRKATGQAENDDDDKNPP